ncbi:MAG: hypothetical protein VW338_05555 [Rhodospirillaceae bacterium]
MTSEPAQVTQRASGMWRALAWRAGLLAVTLACIAAITVRSLDDKAKDL